MSWIRCYFCFFVLLKTVLSSPLAFPPGFSKDARPPGTSLRRNYNPYDPPGSPGFTKASVDYNDDNQRISRISLAPEASVYGPPGSNVSMELPVPLVSPPGMTGEGSGPRMPGSFLPQSIQRPPMAPGSNKLPEMPSARPHKMVTKKVLSNVGPPSPVHPPGEKAKDPNPPGAQTDSPPGPPAPMPSGPEMAASILASGGGKRKAGYMEEYTDKTIDQIIKAAYGDDDTQKMVGPDGDVLAEMDMLLTRFQYEALYGEDKDQQQEKLNQDGTVRSSRVKRKAFSDLSRRWTNGTIPYEFLHSDFTPTEVAIIKASMDEWSDHSCLKFIPAKPWHYNKIRFQNGIGCTSNVGMVGGAQPVNLDEKGCRFRGLYLHELGHAVGRIHEHQTPTRDQFIRVNWDNVKPALKQWFKNYDADIIDSFGVKYDLDSVMHYGTSAFSKDGKSETMEVIGDTSGSGRKIGKVFLKELSFLDKKVTNLMYKCAEHCSPNVSCSGSGYLDKYCRCQCEDGTSNCQVGGDKSPVDGPECVNKYKDDQCRLWSMFGECYLNSDWMAENCQKACRKCPNSMEEIDPICEDQNPRCKEWSRSGQCKSNLNWMLHHCPKSCGRCVQDCNNQHKDQQMCDYWKSIGECSENAAWMHSNCRRSCDKCVKVGDCVNAYPDVSSCRSWAETGECNRNPTWMGENCRKACGICGMKREPVLCENSYKDSAQCDTWARTGECENNLSWMINNCRQSCTNCEGIDDLDKPEPCENKYNSEDCIRWSSRGECKRNIFWMATNCRKACSRCGPLVPDKPIGPDQQCIDLTSTSKCKQWATGGECEANPNWMKKNCRKSCGQCRDKCENVYDNDTECIVWAARGECDMNAKWMTNQCRKACGRCGDTKTDEGTGSCGNKYEDDDECVNWASTGECENNKRWMTNNCRQACNKCEELDTESDTDYKSKCGNIHNGEKCQKWAGTGECENNKDWMTANCRGACEKCPRVTGCGNKGSDTDCLRWSGNGECHANQGYMAEMCKEACGLCTAEDICHNKHNNAKCTKWAANGECEANEFWMKKNCQLACGKCDSKPNGGGDVPNSNECKNEYNDVKCEKWAGDGECDANFEWMEDNCAKACEVCTETKNDNDPLCENIHNDANCERWAEKGECESNPDWMPSNCMKSCKKCVDYDFDAPCVDKHDTTKCAKWAKEGECGNNAEWMEENCAKSCEICKDGVCDNIYEDDGACDRWAKNGECEANSHWMARNCQKSCTNCGGQIEEKDLCTDYYVHPEKCTKWAAKGECKRNVAFMIPNCRKSCKQCATDPVECKNVHPQPDLCLSWAVQGECTKNPDWMARNCKKSCRQCDEDKNKDACQDTWFDVAMCKNWAREGQCLENNVWMSKNCRKSCKICTSNDEPDTNDCEDEYDEFKCRSWGADGECNRNAEWMRVHCAQSCNHCPGKQPIAPECKNIHHNLQECQTWESKGQCVTNKAWMLMNCRKSCTKCGKTDPQSTSTEAPTSTTTTEKRTTTTTTETPTTTTFSPPSSTVDPSKDCNNAYSNPRFCYDWAQTGECEKNPKWMHKNCASACGSCQEFKEEFDEKDNKNTDDASGDVEVTDGSNEVIEVDKGEVPLSSCRDDSEYCPAWASGGECDRSPEYMYVNCRQSCGLCDKGKCVDRNELCQAWSQARSCYTNARYMLTNCPDACGLCNHLKNLQTGPEIVDWEP